MRTLLTFAAIGIVATLGSSTSLAQADDAALVSRSYDLRGFDGVAVIGPHHVTVSVGPAFSIRAEGPRETFDDTVVEIEDGRLEIHPVNDDRWDRRRNEDWREPWRNYRGAAFHITLPRITSASMVGGGEMRVDRVEGDEFSGSIAGSGQLDIGALSVDSARFSVAGSGDLTARGRARNSRISIAGSGDVKAREVTSRNASVSIAGSGNAALTVDGPAHVSIVGSGDVEIAGRAECSVSRFGSGRVVCNGVEQDTRRGWRRSRG